MSLVTLPASLVSAIERESSRFDPRQVRHRARDLSQGYREHEASGARRFVVDELDCVAYCSLLMPATFAQVFGALRMIPLRAGGWRPASLLDVGSGPGTAAWAAVEVWPELSSVTACEREPAFIDVSRRLAREAGEALSGARWSQRDVLEDGLPGGRFDLVVMANVLSELDARDRAVLVERAWGACAGVLVIVEPGTPPTFEVVRAARDRLLGKRANTLAPCPHERPCPMVEDWCHFSERVERPAVQRRTREATLPWEDAKFSLAVMSRFPSVAPPWGRVLRHPRKGKGRITLDLCTPEAIVRATVGKSRGDRYRAAKRLAWGDAVEDGAEIGPSSDPES